MDSRERFLEVMNFNPGVKSLKWEMSYWGGALNNWYRDGLTKKHYPKIIDSYLTISASLYTAAYTHKWQGDPQQDSSERELPFGIAVWGGTETFPQHGWPLDADVRDCFGMDKSMILVDVEQFFYPHFPIGKLDEGKDWLIYTDLDGITYKFLRNEGTQPTAISHPVKDWKTWLEVKEQRLRLDNISKRFPKNFKELLNDYKNRDYPLALGGYPLGIFGILAHLLGYVNLFYFYFDNPGLLKDILNTFTDIWIAVWEEVLSMTDVDAVYFWEDVSTGKSSMISTALFKEFMTPYYKKIIDFSKSKGISIFMVDTDGDFSELIPLFLEAGVTGFYPMETGDGLDLLEVRKKYPNLQMMGGIPKLEVSRGRQIIDSLIENTEKILQYGGYIPHCDHFVPPEVSWEDFKYYRNKLNRLIDSFGK